MNAQARFSRVLVTLIERYALWWYALTAALYAASIASLASVVITADDQPDQPEEQPE